MTSGTPRALAVGAAALALLVFGCDEAREPGGSSSASCAAPYLNDQPPGAPAEGPTRTAAPGEAVTIYGHWYTTTCNDTGGHDPLQPMPPVHLTLALPGGTVTELGEFTGDGVDMGFSTTVRVPAGTPAGSATVRDDQERPASFTFRVRPQP
ncbi:MAG TPA: hypothetical protein VNS81_03860 [Nocardioides sp.]|nr:hypothetical protein [Nocardioides sp.]